LPVFPSDVPTLGAAGVFLNFTNFGPAKALLGVTDEKIGAITTVGFLGILFALPFATGCRWHRTLLVAGGLLNATAPMLRYAAVVCPGWGAATRYSAVLVSSIVQGAAFAVIGAWPATLAALQWPARQRVVVTAVASLSNYAGGALGSVAMPLVANTPAALLGCFRLQALAGVPLTIGLLAFLWLPPVEVSGGASAHDELRQCCCRRRSALVIGTFGLAVGLSLALQGAIQVILEGSGFSALEAGVCNTCYQLLAAVVGVGVGGRITSARSLPATLRALHVGAGVSFALLAALCWLVRSCGRFALAPALAVAASSLLGASLLGMLVRTSCSNSMLLPAFQPLLNLSSELSSEPPCVTWRFPPLHPAALSLAARGARSRRLRNLRLRSRLHLGDGDRRGSHAARRQRERSRLAHDHRPSAARRVAPRCAVATFLTCCGHENQPVVTCQ
jgi:hypothetical protein